MAVVFICCCPLLFSCTGLSPNSNVPECKDSDPVASSKMLPATDTQLFILTRGEHCDAQLMLWLHGGPGGAERPLFRLYNRMLEKRFVVVYWDQRGAGRSFDFDAPPTRLTIAQHLADLDLVVEHLRNRFHKKNVILVGHSWGSALGLLYAREHPEKVAAFVGTAQFVSGIESQRAQYAFVDAEAHHRNDRKAQAILTRIGVPPYSAESEQDIEKLVDEFGGLFHTRPNKFGAVAEGLMRGYATPAEIVRIIRGNVVSLNAMTAELVGLDLRQSVPAVKVPVIFMLGRYDRQVDARLAAAYFDTLRAPIKRLVWFEHSAHNIPFEEPHRFNEILQEELKAVMAQRAATSRGSKLEIRSCTELHWRLVGRQRLQAPAAPSGDRSWQPDREARMRVMSNLAGAKRL